jgi:hypothetical protein
MTSGKTGDRRILQRGWDYEATIPYEVPDSLEELHGPATGTVRVGPPIDTSPHPVYDLSSPERVRSLYSRVIREGITREQVALLNPQLLFRCWGALVLPRRCRALWESRFPSLAAARFGAER